MQISASGILSSGVAGSNRATLTFPTVVPLGAHELLATVRAGSHKDSADERIELWRSSDNGLSWHEAAALPPAPTIAGATGSLKLAYLTAVGAQELIAAAMWVDRSTYPDQALFNPATEGCLPMAIVLSRSDDGGSTWTAWRHVPLPAELGPPSLTNPLLRCADGTLIMSIETNKAYHDAGIWQQRAVLLHSFDGGDSWGEPLVAAEDMSGRIFNWDLRLGMAADERIASFAWTYDRVTQHYQPIHRRISHDRGHTWSAPESLGFADQAGRPAILPDGRMVLPWVDRFGTRSIRARCAAAIDGTFSAKSEVCLYTVAEASSTTITGTGELLADMSLWTFGLPYAAALSDDAVLVLFYAGTPQQMDIHWARIEV